MRCAKGIETACAVLLAASAACLGAPAGAAAGGEGRCDSAAVAGRILAGEYRPALSDLDACPRLAGRARLRGLAYHGLFQPDSTAHFLEQAMKEGGRDDTLLLGLAEAHLWKKRLAKAKRLLGRVADKNTAPYYKAMASLHEAGKDFPKALEMYDKAIPLEKNPWITLFYKAMLLSWMNRLDESIAIYTRLIDSTAASSGFKTKCKIQRAQVISWQKDLEKAEGELREVVKQDPKNVEARLGLAEVLEWQGRFKEAKDQYRDALVADPDNKETKQKIEKLLWVK